MCVHRIVYFSFATTANELSAEQNSSVRKLTTIVCFATALRTHEIYTHSQSSMFPLNSALPSKVILSSPSSPLAPQPSQLHESDRETFLYSKQSRTNHSSKSYPTVNSSLKNVLVIHKTSLASAPLEGRTRKNPWSGREGCSGHKYKRKTWSAIYKEMRYNVLGSWIRIVLSMGSWLARSSTTAKRPHLLK